MALRIETLEGEQALTEFLLFHDQVYEYRSARWLVTVPLQLPILLGQSPFASDRQTQGVRGARGRRNRSPRARDG